MGQSCHHPQGWMSSNPGLVSFSQAARNLPPLAPLVLYRSTLVLDYAGPVDNHMLLMVINAFSKWIEAFQ